MADKEHLPAWETAARRTIEGPKHELETLEGFFFHPKKYSCQGADAIKSASMNIGAGLPPALIGKLADAMDSNENITPEEIMKKLDAETLDELMKSQAADKGNSDLYFQVLKHGIGENNFDEGKKLADKLLKYAEVVQEMIPVIRDWNSPLDKRKSGKSETLQNGSTEE